MAATKVRCIQQQKKNCKASKMHKPGTLGLKKFGPKISSSFFLLLTPGHQGLLESTTTIISFSTTNIIIIVITTITIINTTILITSFISKLKL